MGEMLSFLESRSSAYVAFTEGGRESRPDENYAREIMQVSFFGKFSCSCILYYV